MSAGMVKASDTRALAVATIAAARALCAKVAGGGGPPPQVVAPGDAELQAIAADLAARRDAAIRADDAEAVAAAIEAAILLEPDDPDLHGLAANVLTRVFQANLRVGPDAAAIFPSYRVYRRGLRHLEIFLRRSDDVSGPGFVFSFVNGPNGFFAPRASRPG